MDGTYSVSLLTLEHAVAHTDEIGASIGRLLAELEANVAAKLGSWTGDAQQSYGRCKARWDQAAEQIPSTLTATRATLESIAERYDAAERSAIETFFGGIH
jgi:ESAT-6 family protein